MCAAATGLVGGFASLFIVRLGLGAMQAGAYPTSGSIISRWMPEEEKSTAAMVLNIGLELGGFIALFFTGWACSNPIIGWRNSFYLTGAAPIFWLIFFVQALLESRRSDVVARTLAAAVLLSDDVGETMI